MSASPNGPLSAVPFTLLHISDLHRSPQDPISNEVLLSSLVSDFDRSRTELPPIPAPDAIVVSGDLIQGVPLSHHDHAAAIEAQYGVAFELLAMLADRLLDGDRARVVLVPGNHDVDWNVAYAAMHLVDESDMPANLRPADFGPATNLRWCWKERRAYRIVDTATYERRLGHFQRFVARFYDGAALPYPIEPSSDYYLFELNRGRIAVAAFNSCHGNDCFTFHGAIPDEAVAKAHIDLHDRGPRYDVMMAVWHHNVDGPPGASDYMDVATIYTLIGRGFRLGLHGHQHRSQATNRYVHLPQQEPMALIGAGSLCAGPGDLPTGVNRQYNLIEMSDDLSSVRVHIREMAIATVFAPARRAEFGGESYLDMKLGQPLSAALPNRARDDSIVLQAERALASDDPERALAILRDVETPAGTYARTLAIRAATTAQDWAAAAEVVSPPTSIEELVVLVTSLEWLGHFDDAASVLDEYGRSLQLSAATERDLRLHIAARRRIV